MITLVISIEKDRIKYWNVQTIRKQSFDIVLFKNCTHIWKLKKILKNSKYSVLFAWMRFILFQSIVLQRIDSFVGARVVNAPLHAELAIDDRLQEGGDKERYQEGRGGGARGVWRGERKRQGEGERTGRFAASHAKRMRNREKEEEREKRMKRRKARRTGSRNFHDAKSRKLRKSLR